MASKRKDGDELEISAVIERIQREMDVSLLEISRRTGIHRNTLTKLKQGKVLDPPFSTIKRLTLGMCISPSWFFR